MAPDTVLKGGLVDCGGEFRRTDVVVADGRIRSVGETTKTAAETIDCSGRGARDRQRALSLEARELAGPLLARHDEAFTLGGELLAARRHGWLEALRADVGVNRSVPLGAA